MPFASRLLYKVKRPSRAG